MSDEISSVERFTATVGAYRRWRPTYPDTLLHWVRSVAPGDRCVELGSGTGILTRQLLAAGFQVTGVEPNDTMRAAAMEETPGARFVSRTAEATGLPDGGADLVIGAQAFHWFDLDRALPEIDRVLTPAGIAVAVWNERAPEGFAATYDAILTRFCKEYGGVPRSETTIATIRERVTGEVEQVFGHHQELDLEGVLGRAWSASYVVRGVSDKAGFDAALTEAFHHSAVAGTVVLAYRTIVMAWPRQRSPD